MDNKIFNWAKENMGKILVGTAFVGAISWQPVSSLPTDSIWRVKAQSLAKGTQYFTQNGLVYSTRCTWNVINKPGDVKGNPNVFQMMANGHCDGQSDANNYEMLFPNGDTYICSADAVVKSAWEAFDFMIVNCPAKQGVVIPPIVIDTDANLDRGTRLAHISWNCNYFQNAQCNPVPIIDVSQECRVLKTDVINAGGIVNSLSQACDSQGGSSGSAVNIYYDVNGKVGGPVIALHNSEIQGINHADDGSGTENRSIHIGLVVKEVHKQDPSIKFYHVSDEVEVEGEVGDEEKETPPAVDPFNNGSQCKNFWGYVAGLFK